MLFFSVFSFVFEFLFVGSFLFRFPPLSLVVLNTFPSCINSYLFMSSFWSSVCLFLLFLFSWFLSHVFSFSFFCFVCLSPLKKTSIWNFFYFVIISFVFLTLFVGHFYKFLTLHVCFFSLSFPSSRKKVYMFVVILLCFWTFSFSCSLSWFSVFPLFLIFIVHFECIPFFWRFTLIWFDYPFSAFFTF